MTNQAETVMVRNENKKILGGTLMKTISNRQVHSSSGPAATAGMSGGVTVVKTMIELFGSY